MSGSSNSNDNSNSQDEETLILIDQLRGLIRNSELSDDEKIARSIHTLISKHCKSVQQACDIIQASKDDSPIRIAIERGMPETLYMLCYLGNGPWQFNPVTCHPRHTLEEIRELMTQSPLCNLPCKGATEWSAESSNKTTWLELIDLVIIEVGDLEKRFPRHKI